MAKRKQQNLIPPGPYRIEAIQDDESEIGILAGDEEIAIVYDWNDVPGSARALAELFLKALETRP
jgi:hypothetical protein